MVMNIERRVFVCERVESVLLFLERVLGKVVALERDPRPSRYLCRPLQRCLCILEAHLNERDVQLVCIREVSRRYR